MKTNKRLQIKDLSGPYQVINWTKVGNGQRLSSSMYELTRKELNKKYPLAQKVDVF